MWKVNKEGENKGQLKTFQTFRDRHFLFLRPRSLFVTKEFYTPSQKVSIREVTNNDCEIRS